MTYNGSEYFYLTNLQGAVTGLADAAGATVVSYSYDSWGKLTSTTGSMASSLGVKNPYRYRGYRYDTETGLYYLQSRYSNPELGRFINADDSAILRLTSGKLLTPNLFTYCNNNPANSSDPTGYVDAWLIADIAFTLAGINVFFQAKKIFQVLYWSGRLIKQYYQYRQAS
jgi:RHS repeat-associated protein